MKVAIIGSREYENSRKIEYPAVAGKNNKNCKWCEFKDRLDLCPRANRIRV